MDITKFTFRCPLSNSAHNATPEEIEGDPDIVVVHRRWRPSDLEGGGRPDSPQGTPIGEGGVGPFVDPEWFRRVDDLNKEFTDQVRDYGGVEVGREVRGSFSGYVFRRNKEGR